MPNKPLLCFTAQDRAFMQQALHEATLAGQCHEVPIGAVVVKDGQIIGRGHNRMMEECDPCAHAEIMAIRAACQHIGTHRLDGCALYVTIEPCCMCSGAIIASHIAHVIYGAPEPKTGAAGSVVNLFAQHILNHHSNIRGGLLEKEAQRQMQSFFSQRRLEQAERRLQNQEFLRQDMLRTPVHHCQRFLPPSCTSYFMNQWHCAKDIRLHYFSVGEDHLRPALLLIPPLPLWSAWFSPLIPLFSGHRIFALDRLGCGLSDKPKKYADTWNLIEIQLVIEWVAQLNLPNFIVMLTLEDKSLATNITQSFPLQCGEIIFVQFLADAAIHEEEIEAPFVDKGFSQFVLGLIAARYTDKKTSPPVYKASHLTVQNFLRKGVNLFPIDTAISKIQK